MATFPKIFLAISAAGFVAGGILDFGGFNLNPAAAVVLPLGAVFFGVFMIWNMMAKEMAAFDAEEAMKQPPVERAAVKSAPPGQGGAPPPPAL